MAASAASDVRVPGRTVPLIIDNKDITTTTTLDVNNPGKSYLEHKCSSASVEDATQAVDSAQRAFPAWSKTRPAARREILLKAADVFLARKDEFIGYMCEETGAQVPYADFILMLGVNLLRDVAGKVSNIEATSPVLAQEGTSAMVYKQPYGVVLGIAPWNAPYILGTRAVALPLAAGNTTVLKGSELSPKCFWAIGEAFRQAGLPDGCLNVLYARPEDAAEVTTALIAHPAVKKLSFTGSTAIGRKVAQIAANYIKPVILELGGKAPTVVLDDADIEKAALGAAIGSFMHTGQVCMCTERIIVHRSIADKFREALKAAINNVLGGPNAELVAINAGAIAKNKALVRDAISKGGRVLLGDPDAQGASDTRMSAVIVENVTKDMDIYEDESFGPTASLFVVDSDEEAIKLANDTEYGLSAAVYTENLARGLYVAGQIESGAVHINSMTVHDEAALPHGGVKRSGYGRFGTKLLDEFLWTKSVTWMDYGY
ncbi:conserved hypothetical protein [Aspergillus terreus NIH2624]|uniref:Aldehyde dehydrogenase domain-containing protein n=1 Tax=Aspergillus terreus (strain NIH 2624 / FGSC A1156) TaxID=341663 RepID=Q0CIG5_ASPTN|nr:uncharacterized protein ATEG_06519 [Aspergillus terreus NIH2624]EAU33063.1 conserved hypothetical protein [Aspergillus terreus NIH2624]